MFSLTLIQHLDCEIFIQQTDDFGSDVFHTPLFLLIFINEKNINLLFSSLFSVNVSTLHCVVLDLHI